MKGKKLGRIVFIVALLFMFTVPYTVAASVATQIDGMEGISPPTGTTISAGSANSIAENAIDHNINTAWNAGAFTGYIQLIFPKQINLSFVQLAVNVSPSSSDVNYILYGLKNGEWTVIRSSQTLTINNGTGGAVILNPLDVTPGTYDGIKIQASSSKTWIAINEITTGFFDVRGLSATAGDSQVTLSWDQVTNADSYIIHYGTQSGNYTEMVTATKDQYGNFVIPGLANGITYYFVVSATANGVESDYSNEISVTPVATKRSLLDVIVGENNVAVGENFVANISLKNVNNIYAEDFTIQYDTNLFEFIGFDQVQGYKVYNTPTDDNGKIRFIVSSQGKNYGISQDTTFLKLNFKAKAVGTGNVDAQKCRIADTKNEWDLGEESCGIDTITVGEPLIQDVNKSGEYSLVDLAIDGYYFGVAAANTDTVNHVADQVVDGNVNDADLLYIVNQMLNNPNYPPNF